MSTYTDIDISTALIEIANALKQLASGLDNHTTMLRHLAQAMNSMNQKIDDSFK